MIHLKYFSSLIIVGFLLVYQVDAQEDNEKWHSSFSANILLHKNLLGSQYNEPDSTNSDYPNKYFYNIKNQFHFEINYHLHYKLNENWSVSSGLSMYNSYVQSILNVDFMNSLPEYDVPAYPWKWIDNKIFTSIPIRLEYHLPKMFFYADFKPIVLTIRYWNEFYNEDQNREYFGIRLGTASNRFQVAPIYTFGIVYPELIDIKDSFHLGLNASYSSAPRNYYAYNYFSTGVVVTL